MDKVYIVTSGEYSDYGIVAVFKTKEEAELLLKQHNYEGLYYKYRIEEYEFDKPLNRPYYTVSICGGDANVNEAEEYSESAIDTVKYGGFNSYHKQDTFYFKLESDSAERAIKVARERLMQVKAHPYLYPRLKEECVLVGNNSYYPTYNFRTCEIILQKGEILCPF